MNIDLNLQERGMVASASLATMALIALGGVLSPGPNMMYLVSRSISQDLYLKDVLRE